MKSVYSQKDVQIKVVGGMCEKCNITGKKISLNQIKPEGMCMHAFHVLFPYILTFKKDGSFSWTHNKDDVEVQCPNPSVGVNMELCKLDNKNFEVKINKIKGVCPNKYNVGDVFKFNPEELGICPGAFNAVFPYLNAVIFGSGEYQIACPNPECDGILKLSNGKKLKIKEICRTDEIKIRAAGMSRICHRYHKHLDEIFSVNSAANGLCPDAFHVAYPYCLALLYNAKFNSEVKLKCPNATNNVVMEIIKKPRTFYFLIKLIKRLSRPIYPLDLIDSDIIIKIIGENGKCLRGYKVGEEFVFNTGQTKGLCPASFNSIYPAVYLLENDINPPWGPIGQCPDCTANVTYQLAKHKKDKGLMAEQLREWLK